MTQDVYNPDANDEQKQPEGSSFIGGLDVVDYGYKRTRAAGLTAYAARSLLEAIRDHTSIGAISRCFPYYRSNTWPPLAKARFASGQFFLNKCGNKNACVVCARANDAKVRKEFCEQFDHFIRQGYKPYWQTFDIGFRSTISGTNRVRIIGLIWRKLNQNTKYRKLIGKSRVLSLRVTEFAYLSDVEHWNPHLHVVWLFDIDVKQVDIDAFMAFTSNFWRSQQNLLPECEPNNRALYFAKIEATSTRQTGNYLFKAFFIEMHHFQVKTPGNQKTPLHYLIDFALKGDTESLTIWQKYEVASRNTRRYTFSSGWGRAYKGSGNKAKETLNHNFRDSLIYKHRRTGTHLEFEAELGWIHIE